MQYQNGMVGNAFQFEFSLEIENIILPQIIDIPKGSFLEIVWKRGQNQIVCKLRPQIRGNEGQVHFNQILAIYSTCIMKDDGFSFLKRDSSLQIIIYIDGAAKTFGNLGINLSSILNVKNFREKNEKYFDEEINSKTKARIIFKLRSNFIEEVQKNEERSVGSGVKLSSNANPFSIDRKLLESPPNDTRSVTSFASSIRYSNKNEGVGDKRDDYLQRAENNLRQESRGEYQIKPYLFSPSPQESISSPIIKSVPSSESKITRNTVSDQNRSSLGDQNHKMLIDEQNKRIKMEIEITKSNTEKEELKTKLTEYLRDNIKLKEELKQFANYNVINDENKVEYKKENDQLKSDLRELKAKIGHYEKERSSIQNEKEKILRERMQNEETIEQMRRELSELQKELGRTKENEGKLYGELKEKNNNKSEFEELKKRIKEIGNELEYYKGACKNLNDLLKESEIKCQTIDAKMKSNQSSFDAFKMDYLDKFSELTVSKEKEVKALTNELLLKSEECTKYLMELDRLSDGKIREIESMKNMLSFENEKMKNEIMDLKSQLQNLENERSSLNHQINSSYSIRSQEVLRLKELDQKYNRLATEKSSLQQLVNQLENENMSLHKNLEDKTKRLEETGDSKVQLQQVMKQNVELELEIKFKNEEIVKKDRLQSEERTNSSRLYNQLKDSLNKTQETLMSKEEILRNFDQQSKEKDYHIREQEKVIKGLQEDLRRTKDTHETIGYNDNRYCNNLSSLEARNKELEKRENDTIKSIESLHRCISNSNAEIKELQSVLQKSEQELKNRDQTITSLKMKTIDLETENQSLLRSLGSSTQERKSVQKKNEMIMDELYSYKKKFEEEKEKIVGKELGLFEDYLKIQKLENELENQRIENSKLMKEVSCLENTNISLNIQLMKRLGENTPY